MKKAAKTTRKDFFELSIIEQKKVIHEMIKKIRSIPKYGHADKYNIDITDETMDELHATIALSLWEVVANGGKVDGLLIYIHTMTALDGLHDANSKLSFHDFYDESDMLYWMDDNDESMMVSYGTLPKIDDVLKEYDGMTAGQIIDRASYNDKQREFLETIAYTDMSIKDALIKCNYKSNSLGGLRDKLQYNFHKNSPKH